MAASDLQSIAFKVSFAEYVKRQVSGRRMAFASYYRAQVAIVAGFLIALWSTSGETGAAVLEFISPRLGISCEAAGWLISLVYYVTFLTALAVAVRSFRKEQAARIGQELNWTVSLTGEGVRFARPDIEHLVKWGGIYRMLRESNATFILHGDTSFFVPDTAFASSEVRKEFMEQIYSRMPTVARLRTGEFDALG